MSCNDDILTWIQHQFFCYRCIIPNITHLLSQLSALFTILQHKHVYRLFVNSANCRLQFMSFMCFILFYRLCSSTGPTWELCTAMIGSAYHWCTLRYYLLLFHSLFIYWGYIYIFVGSFAYLYKEKRRRRKNWIILWLQPFFVELLRVWHMHIILMIIFLFFLIMISNQNPFL